MGAFLLRLAAGTLIGYLVCYPSEIGIALPGLIYALVGTLPRVLARTKHLFWDHGRR